MQREKTESSFFKTGIYYHWTKFKIFMRTNKFWLDCEEHGILSSKVWRYHTSRPLNMFLQNLGNWSPRSVASYFIKM